MKILMLNYEFPPIGGGAGQAHYQLLRQYAKIPNLQIDLLTCGTQRLVACENFAENISIYKVGINKNNLHYWRKSEVIEWLIRSKKHYRRLINQNNYDLVHAFFGFPTGWLCYRTVGEIPYMISLRGSDVPGLNRRLSFDYKILSPVFKRIWKNAAMIVACSNGLKKRALQFLPGSDIEVIPNGIDLEKFKPIEQRGKGTVNRLLTVGRLSATKRIELLISTMDIIRQDRSDITLTIAGGGVLKESLQQLAKQKQLQNTITFTDIVPTDQMPQLYRQHDLFISATAQEGMSNAMLEAMASGLPIVTTNCEGLEELIGDNGIIVQDNQPQAFADIIKQLANEPETINNMALAARQRASQFQWKTVAEKYINCYKQLIDNTGNSNCRKTQ